MGYVIFWYIILAKYQLFLNMRCLYSIGMFGTNLGLLIGVLCKIWQIKIFVKLFKNPTIPTFFAE